MKIRTRFNLLIMIFVIVFFTIMYFVSSRIFKNRIIEDAGNHINTAVKFKAYNIETLLTSYNDFTELLAAGVPFRQYFDADIDKIFREKNINDRINSIIEINHSISSIRVLNTDGIVVASNHDDVGMDRSKRKEFLAGKRNTYIGDLHFSEYTGEYVLSVATSIYTKKKLFGVIIINYIAENQLFPTIADQTGLMHSTNIYLLNKDYLLLSPTKYDDKIMETKIYPKQIELCRDDHLKNKISKMDLKGNIFYTSYRGHEVLGTHRYISDMQWFLIIEVNKADMTDSIMKSTNLLTILFAVILILSLGISYIISVFMTKPIKRLESGVLKIIDGDMKYKVATKSKNEIGQLSRVFDQLTSKLLKSQKKLETQSIFLEKQVKERTKELEKKVTESKQQRQAILNVAADLEKININLISEVNERKKDEIEIRKLSTAVEQSPSIIAITDVKGNLEYVNPKFTELTGYTIEETKGLNPRILKSGDQPDEIYKEMWELASSGKEWRGEFHNRKKNGELFWEAASISPILNKHGEIINYIKVAEDITQRKQDEKKLIESEEKLRLIIDNSPIGFSTTDLKGNFTAVNNAFCSMIGYFPEEIKTMHFNQFSHPDDKVKNIELYEKLVKGEISYFDFEKRYIHKNGEIIHVLIRSQLIRNHKGEPYFEIAIVEDITKRKYAENKLNSRIKELEIFNEATVNRELMINELREEINELLIRLGEEVKYDIVE